MSFIRADEGIIAKALEAQAIPIGQQMARLLATLILAAAIPTATLANPVVMVTALPDGSVQIEGKHYSDPKVLQPKISEIEHREPKPSFSITVSKPRDMNDVKALGGAIWLLQKSGVERIGILNEPTPQ